MVSRDIRVAGSLIDSGDRSQGVADASSLGIVAQRDANSLAHDRRDGRLTSVRELPERRHLLIGE